MRSALLLHLLIYLMHFLHPMHFLHLMHFLHPLHFLHLMHFLHLVHASTAALHGAAADPRRRVPLQRQRRRGAWRRAQLPPVDPQNARLSWSIYGHPQQPHRDARQARQKLPTGPAARCLCTCRGCAARAQTARTQMSGERRRPVPRRGAASTPTSPRQAVCPNTRVARAAARRR